MKLQSSGIITSAKNIKVREAVKLMERRHRDQAGLMLVEGLKELEIAFKGRILIRRLLYCEELFQGHEERTALKRARDGGAEIVPVSLHVFRKTAYREESAGLIAVAEQPVRTLNDIPLKKTPLIVVVEGVEKPGNLGAILRSADAAGVNGVIVCGGTDIYNPNVVRASMGAVFSVPVVAATVSESVRWLKKRGIKTVATTPHAGSEYFDADLAAPCAIVMGSEHEGLSGAWLDGADVIARIPMEGEVDSLNIATAASILLYEAIRQRRSTPLTSI